MDFDTLLGQIEATRPDLTDSLSLVRQYRKQQDDNNDAAEEVEASKVKELASVLEKQKHLNRNLFQQYQRLENNYELLIEQLDQLAEAIGACPHCWGEDSNCKYCRGRGKPGHFEPNEQFFDLYIKPVILKLKNNKS